MQTPQSTPARSVRIRTVRLYYGTLSLVLLVTLIAQCILTHSEGRSLVNTFSYFTIQSNVLVLVSSTLLALYPTTLRGVWWRVLRLAALTGITVTGLVYILLLAKYVHLTGIALVYNYIFHYAMPILTVIGYVLVEPRQYFKWKDYIFIAWPVAWLIYTMARAAFFNPQFTGFTTVPSKYPYEFLDVTRTPMVEVTGSIIFLCLLIIAVGMAYIYADEHKPFRMRTASTSVSSR